MMKEKKNKQRQQNRRSKQSPAALAGKGCSSVSSSQLSQKVTNIAFNSLPSIHIGEDEPSVSLAEGEISRFCLLPNSTSSQLEVSASASEGSGLLQNRAKRKYFVPHWPEEAAEGAIEKGNAFTATFRVNAHNRLEAYCTIDGVPVDVLIDGVVAQNRAIEGDTVAIVLDPVSCWTKLKGSNASNNAVLPDDTNIIPQAKELVSKSCSRKEHVNANGLLAENGCCDVSSNVPPHMYTENKYVPPDKLDEFQQQTAPENLDPGASQQGESSRALRRIISMINSCPSKRPTGRVVAIIKKSPRRQAVIGFLAAKKYFVEGEGYWMQNSGFLVKKGKNKVSVPEEGCLQLLPKDPKFPKMLVSFRNLPESAKERLNNGDETVERELVSAQIDEWNAESLTPLAHVIHILGRGGEIEPQVAAILFENAICSANFSPESLACLPDLPWEIPVEELEARKDFRNICTFTIDPAGATDLDDALSIEMVSDEVFRIGVHITDVSYFVLPETALDTEAQIRSTSVYILQHRIPMLPPQLSEELCSILPGNDRLALSIIWDINRSGNIIYRWIGRSIIRSCCKLSYDLVQDIIDGSLDADKLNSSGSAIPQLDCLFKWEDIFRSLRSLYEISVSLRRNRFEDGALLLDGSKLGFLFDEFGTPYDSFLHERTESNSLVEEFMLLANRSIAEVTSIAFPECALLRRHPEPNIRKLRDFEAFCNKHGFELDTSSSGQFHLSLSKIGEKLKDDLVFYDILMNYASKPMQPASYFCTGDLRGKENEWAHYALSVPLYTHFTSPMRRYADIIVHRILCATLDAEEAYLNRSQINNNEAPCGEHVTGCFTGILLNKNAVESEEGREALAASAMRFRVPVGKVLSEIAAYCNEKKFASRRAEEAGEKLYLWALLKKKEIIVSEARVLALGPRFMSVYIPKLAMERRINYEDVEGLSVEWLELTSTLLLDFNGKKRPRTVGKLRAIEDVALLTNPSEESEAAVFPLVLRNLSTITVALHAVGGDDGPLDIGVRLYICSYIT